MTISNKRRLLLKGTVGAGVLAGAGLLTPRSVLAAWPQTAFTAKTVDEGIGALHDGSVTASDAVTLKAPDIAENGAVVPISVTTTLAGVTRISIFASNNPSPLAASFELGPRADGYASTRIKMGKTANIVAVVAAGGKLYSATKEVKVTIGGCGG